MRMTEYRVSYILGPPDDEELITLAFNAEDEYQACFQSGYKLREQTDGRPARILSITKYSQPQQIYFRPNPNASDRAEKSTIRKDKL